MNRRQRIGQWGEEIAANHLLEHGCKLVARNVRTSYGEIDLIVQQDKVTIFVEVKTRTNRAYGFPEEAVNRSKQIHIVNSAEEYLQQHPEITGDWRVDVLSILGKPGENNIQIEWFENAISG